MDALEEVLLYGGKESGKHESGLSLLQNKQAKERLGIQWEILTAILFTKYRNITALQHYVPTNQSPLDGDILIVMAEFNERVGNNNTNMKNVMGQHGLGDVNENGKFFIWAHTFVIGGTIFSNLIIHKVTWVSPD